MVNLTRLANRIAAAIDAGPQNNHAAAALESLLDDALGSARRRLPLHARLRLTEQHLLSTTAPAIALRRFTQLTHAPTPAEHTLANALADPAHQPDRCPIAAAARAAALAPAAARNPALTTAAGDALLALRAALTRPTRNQPHRTTNQPTTPPPTTPAPDNGDAAHTRRDIRSRPGGRARSSTRSNPPSTHDLALAAWLLAPALNLPATPTNQQTLRDIATHLHNALLRRGADFDPAAAPLLAELTNALNATSHASTAA